MLLIGGAQVKHIVALTVARGGWASALFLNSGMLETYQQCRLTSFLEQDNPDCTARGCRVQRRAGQDGDRLRRLPRQGPLRGHPDPPRHRARAAHRLHLHGRGGGARASSGRPRCSCCSSLIAWRIWRTAQLVARPAGHDDLRRGAGDVRVPGVRERRHDHGDHAGDGHPVAFHVLRRFLDPHGVHRAWVSSSTSTCAGSADPQSVDAFAEGAAEYPSGEPWSTSGPSWSPTSPRCRSLRATSAASSAPRSPPPPLTGSGGSWCTRTPTRSGLPNQGLQILYEILNERDDAVAERSYAPWTDLEEVLRREAIPLFSVDTHRSADEFDVVAFNLSAELVYTNVLNCLDLAGIPVRAADRAAEHPLVGAGGHATYNPEPLADFLDFVVLGDGEEVVSEINEVVGGVEGRRTRRPDRRAAGPRRHRGRLRPEPLRGHLPRRRPAGRHHADRSGRTGRRSRSARSPTWPTGRTRSSQLVPAHRGGARPAQRRGVPRAAPVGAGSARPG